jgi:ribosomal protein S18 acetylase RimI-like enzyme
MEPKDITIEQVKDYSSDVEGAVRNFVSHLGKNYQPFTADSLKEIVNSPQSFLFIARHVPTNTIAGMVFEIVYRIPYAGKAYIDDLFIDEKFRKIGIATRLMQKAVENAKAHKASYIEFTSNPQRIESNNLYSKLGFTKRETNVYRLSITYEEV